MERKPGEYNSTTLLTWETTYYLLYSSKVDMILELIIRVFSICKVAKVWENGAIQMIFPANAPVGWILGLRTLTMTGVNLREEMSRA